QNARRPRGRARLAHDIASKQTSIRPDSPCASHRSTRKLEPQMFVTYYVTKGLGRGFTDRERLTPGPGNFCLMWVSALARAPKSTRKRAVPTPIMMLPPLGAAELLS